MIRALSGTPLLEDMIRPESKFVGEALEMKDVRTVFVGAREDEKDRENNVILMIGPSSAERAELIDFFCNFFYGVRENDAYRYNIANEKFNVETPYRNMQCYIFNNTEVSVRPVIIDTPGCGTECDGHSADVFINKWLMDNWKVRIDTIAVVLSDLHRITTKEEDELQNILSNLPHHAKDNISVFITASDGVLPFESLLDRFGLSNCPKYTINTSCVFRKQIEDKLNDEHRKRYWKMSMNQFNNYLNKSQEQAPVTISGLPFIDDALYGAHESGESSRNSVYSASVSTVVEVKQPSRSSSPPLPPPPVLPKYPPPPPPKPTMPPPPIPSSPPPSLTQTVDVSGGIPLYSEKKQHQNTASNAPPPRPPNFAPPKPPAAPNRIALTDSTSTPALTNAMYEQYNTTSNRSSHHYDYAYSEQEYQPVRMREQNGERISQVGGLGERRQSVPDDIRHYADETTPPPVVTDVADRYSTVAYMNHDQHYSTRIGNSSPTRTIPVRDAHRLSREDLRVVDTHSSPTDSQSDELRRMYSGRSAQSIKPTGDVTYVYDTSNRSYTAYGERQARPTYVATDRKRWSKSSEARSETYINDPYYSGKDVVSGYGVIETRHSRTSLHSNGTVPELVHSENKYDYQQIGDGHQAKEIYRRSRQDDTRRDRRQSEGSQQIYIDRQISPERQRKDRTAGNINMNDNPQYNIPRDRQPPAIPPKQIPPPQPPIHRISGGEVYEDRTSMYDAYSKINHQRNQPQYRPGQGVQPQQPPYPQKYDEVPDQSQANTYIIPNAMRGNRSPIQQPYDPYGEYVGRQQQPPYGLTEETTTTTTTTRNEEIERKRRRKEKEDKKRREEEQKQRNVPITNNGGGNYDAYQDSTKNYEHYNGRDAEHALLEQEYNTKHMVITTEHQKQRHYDDEVEYGHRDQRVAQRDKNKKNSNSRKVVHTRNSSLGWSPSNYSNPRDCFLNILCFIIAPLVIIAIIVVIIIFVIIQ